MRFEMQSRKYAYVLYTYRFQKRKKRGVSAPIISKKLAIDEPKMLFSFTSCYKRFISYDINVPSLTLRVISLSRLAFNGCPMRTSIRKRLCVRLALTLLRVQYPRIYVIPDLAADDFDLNSRSSISPPRIVDVSFDYGTERRLLRMI